MKTFKLLLAAAACASLVQTPVPATAGNHLACYKVKDTIPRQKIPNVALLSNTGEGPNHTGCIIATGSKLCCDAVDKIGVPPQPGGGGPTGNTTQFCCYKVKCPKGPTGVLNIKDQFGTRSLAVTKPPKMICAPSSASGAFLDAASVF